MKDKIKSFQVRHNIQTMEDEDLIGIVAVKLKNTRFHAKERLCFDYINQDDLYHHLLHYDEDAIHVVYDILFQKLVDIRKGL